MARVNASNGTIALVFPGQGSQYVGMGKELYQSCPEAREVFHRADRILGFDLSTLCFEGPEDLLNRTDNAQPAILTVSVALLRVLERREPSLWERVRFVAGHSLGEYSALVSAGALEFDSTLRLVRGRGLQMRRAGEYAEGGMVAVIGLDREAVQGICREVMAAHDGSKDNRAGAWIANHNAPTQIIISGTRDALARVEELARVRGAKKVVRLAVSVASHTPLMAPAVNALRRLISQVEVRPPRVPVLGNVSGAPLSAPEEIREELIRQVSSPVRWVESVQHILSQGVSNFIEVGPKRVLGGLIRRIDRSARIISLDDEKYRKRMLENTGGLEWI